jgi:hypothetical protein
VSDNLVLGIALILMLVALPFVSLGATEDIPFLWWVGLAMIGLGGVVGPVSRYALGDDEESDE